MHEVYITLVKCRHANYSVKTGKELVTLRSGFDTEDRDETSLSDELRTRRCVIRHALGITGTFTSCKSEQSGSEVL